eukprot:6287740-Prymnesium_polylepis.1
MHRRRTRRTRVEASEGGDSAHKPGTERQAATISSLHIGRVSTVPSKCRRAALIARHHRCSASTNA